MIQFLRSLFRRDDPGAEVGAMVGASRSWQWPKVRDAWLKDHPCCAMCGTPDEVEVHHKRPFHVAPELELDPLNFVSLCRPHHLLAGHLMNWSSWNEQVMIDVTVWQRKIAARPRAVAAG